MEFRDTVTLENVSMEEVWLTLSDPVMIENAAPGCQLLVEIDEEDPDFEELVASASNEDVPTLPEADPEEVAERAFEEGGRYAAIIEISVGSIKPRFETVVTIDRREFPETEASGEGSTGNSSFEVDAGMHLTEVDEGVTVEWWAQAEVFGRIAQMGQRVIDPVASRVAGRFFQDIENQLSDVSEEPATFRDRIRSLI